MFSIKSSTVAARASRGGECVTEHLMLTGIIPDNEIALLGSRMQSIHRAARMHFIFKLEIIFFFPLMLT